MNEQGIYFDLSDLNTSRNEFEHIIGSEINDDHWNEIMHGIAEIYSDDMDPSQHPLGIQDALGMYAVMLLKDSENIDSVQNFMSERLSVLSNETPKDSEGIVRNVRMIETQISRGLSEEIAINQSGVDESTFLKWRKQYAQRIRDIETQEGLTLRKDDKYIFPQPDSDWQPHQLVLCVFQHKPYKLLEKQRISLIWGDTIFGPDFMFSTQNGARMYINWWIKKCSGQLDIIKFDAFWHNSESVLVILELDMGKEQVSDWLDVRKKEKTLEQWVMNPEIGNNEKSPYSFTCGYRAIAVESPRNISASFTAEKSTSIPRAVKVLTSAGFEEVINDHRHGPLVGREFKRQETKYYLSEQTMLPIDENGKWLLSTEISKADERDMFHESI